MTNNKTLLQKQTALQKRREARDRAIYDEYNTLAANPHQSRLELNKYLMIKYDIHSAGTLYLIRKRVEERLQEHEETL